MSAKKCEEVTCRPNGGVHSHPAVGLLRDESNRSNAVNRRPHPGAPARFAGGFLFSAMSLAHRTEIEFEETAGAQCRIGFAIFKSSGVASLGITRRDSNASGVATKTGCYVELTKDDAAILCAALQRWLVTK